MTVLRIFISSVQKELADERRAIRDFLIGDALLRKFFDVFLFEDVPAADKRADTTYLDEVARCDLYLGIFGNEYGWQDENGLSPTHHEFREATRLGKTRLIFVKGSGNAGRHPKMSTLIDEAGASLIRRRFNASEELVSAVYASLIRILEEREIIRYTPFDATWCRNASIDDLDNDKINRFLIHARNARSFPLADGTQPIEVLTHLNLLDKSRPTHAAILLFGKSPQHFVISSEVKCARFHGFDIEKPIPSYQVYKGTLFDLIDQSKDFVLSKIDLWTGDRSQGVQVPTSYEIPQEVVSEAIVNAICHRDYTSNGSVQVMLFKDRLEVWNPGSLPPSLTVEMLRQPHGSVPHNPLIAEPLYLTKYIERMGTGIRDMITRCNEAGLREPEIRIEGGFWITTIWRKWTPSPDRYEPASKSYRGVTGEVTGEVTPYVPLEVTDEVMALIKYLSDQTVSRTQLQIAMNLQSQANFRDRYLQPALEFELVEMTIPDKPKSRLQKYRLTDKGRQLLLRH
ncbi:MAG: DUF4062 domain-containing protein [Bacteroidetes bacterium]|nr:DUF4062 domain-containing protein [Bacteroidota bacterium]